MPVSSSMINFGIYKRTNGLIDEIRISIPSNKKFNLLIDQENFIVNKIFDKIILILFIFDHAFPRFLKVHILIKAKSTLNPIDYLWLSCLFDLLWKKYMAYYQIF